MPNDAPVDPARVRELVDEFTALTEAQFTQALAENLLDEDPAETAAFRSPDLAFRSYAAARALLESTNATIQRRAGESNKSWEARAVHFRTRAGQERRLLEVITSGIRAQQGIPPSVPNPRARAARELQRRHPEEYLALVRKHQAEIIEENRRKKAEQKAARKAARGQGRPGR